ncbi:family 78 glycoside hydrolase catalytic domain [Streptomyces sp. NPDC047061]|uniref:family 78 glycoside hydrolase catalytic domain n=1 Tax=Streptomyces sp. NPDC047061 TaxID=3154605 RepID=UPI0033E870F5
MTIWTGRFIAPENDIESAPRFRREFSTEPGHGGLVAATLRLSALGICEAWINGRPVTDAVLTPGWTSYEWRLHFVELDVTALVDEISTLAITVGNGWYRGRLGWIETTRYGLDIAAFAELRLTYADGHETVIVTDESWMSGPGPVVADDLYNGQAIDARREDGAWLHPGFQAEDWGGVRLVDYDRARLSLDPAPPVRRIAHLHPQRTWRSSSGGLLLDFGQNVVGWLKLRVRGPVGALITARHAEVLEDGELCVRPLRSALATDHFTLSGGDDTFEPTMTFHGFRYAELTGWPEGVPVDDAVTAVVVSSDLRRTGEFECSDPDLTTFHENVVRGMQGNFVDVPTDCPQRDERLGWTGDLAAFAPTAAFLFDVKDFLLDWLRDLALEQSHADVVPLVVPDVLKHAVDTTPGQPAGPPSGQPVALWSDAAVWVPWALWEAYGELTILGETLPAMLAHARRVRAALSPSGLWDTGFQFGDWLDPDAPAEHPERAKADPGVVATACAYRTMTLVAETARLLGKSAEAEEFASAAADVRAAFRRHYIDEQRITSDCASVYALAIAFEVLDETERAWAGDRLAQLVETSGHRISTGFAGTPFVTGALSSTGHTDTAYRLLLQRQCPSWLYPVTMGATTVWERWDSMLPDGRINPGDMTSFNHYALGAVADWIHRTVGGIAPLTAGYRHILVAPKVADGIDWARCALQTPHGRVAVEWHRQDDRVTFSVTVPRGSSAVFRWPGHADRELPSGHHTLDVAFSRLPVRNGVAG